MTLTGDMASDTVTGCTEDAVTSQPDEAVSSVKQEVEHIEGRLMTLSERMTLCRRVLSDLRDLSDVLVAKSLQDVALPPQK